MTQDELASYCRAHLAAPLKVTAVRTVLAYNSDYDHNVIAADCARLDLDARHLGEPRTGAA